MTSNKHNTISTGSYRNSSLKKLYYFQSSRLNGYACVPPSTCMGRALRVMRTASLHCAILSPCPPTRVVACKQQHDNQKRTTNNYVLTFCLINQNTINKVILL